VPLQAITAMAHLRAAVLYVVDLSEMCGYSLEQQAALFHSLKPLFTNKPTIIVANKTDACPWESLSDEQRTLVEGMAAEALRLSHGGVTVAGGASPSEKTLLFMSTLQGDGVQAAKNAACDRLLAMREQIKVQSKRAGDIANRLHVAIPKPRDHVQRPPCVPAAVLAERAASGGGAGPSGQAGADLSSCYFTPF
jgi:nucleolar GTP-binding protein